MYPVHGGEEDDIKALSQLENDIAQAWVQRDTQTLDRILAGDYTFAGAGDVLIDKEQCSDQRVTEEIIRTQ